MNVLIAEDDELSADLLRNALSEFGYQADVARNGREAYTFLRSGRYRMAVVDWQMPEMDGIELCRRIRSRQTSHYIYIVVLTSQAGDHAVVEGLSAGADDYVTKPFSLRELLARVRALLRRAQPPRTLIDELRVNDVAVDFRKYEATAAGGPLELTRREFQLLRALASRPGEVVSRSELLDQVWGLDEYPTTRTVDTHIAALRAKIERDPANPEHLLTMRGVGYKWVA
jgi:two-component system alkaline phosphatase synthesis response regulator PhoP